METTPKNLMREFVNSQKFKTTTDIMNAMKDKELFEEVQIIMNERKQIGKKAGYLCSGLAYCG